MSPTNRIEKLLAEIVEDWPTRYYVDIDSDAFKRWTVTLWHSSAPIRPPVQINHWHTDDLEDGLKLALIAKQNLTTKHGDPT